MKNKLYISLLVLGLISFDALMGSSFGMGRGPGWQNNVQIGSVKRSRNEQQIFESKSAQRVDQVMQSKDKSNNIGGNRSTFAPSQLENNLIKESNGLKDLAGALRQLRMENPAIFTQYFGDKALGQNLSDQSTDE